MAPPMENFPLPIELREELYSYLLSPEATCDSKWTEEGGCEPEQVYGFHPAILAVNKQISAEAAGYFSKPNCFVQISCTASDIQTHLELLDIRVWPTGEMHDIPCVSYAVQLSEAENFFCAPADAEQWQFQSTLILERDVSKLWAVLRGGTFVMPSCCAHICSDRDELLQLGTGDDQQAMPTVTVWARNNSNHVSLSADRKRAFLEPARACFGDFIDAIFVGFTTDGSPLRTSACSIIWPLAFAWHKVDALMTLKADGDELAVDGNLELAMTKYRYAEFCANQWFERDFPVSGDGDSRDYMDDVIWGAMHALRFDIEFTIVLINFHSGKIPDRITLNTLSSPLEPRRLHLVVLTELLCHTGPPSRKRVLHTIRCLQSLPVNADVLHDLDHLQSALRFPMPKNFAEAFRGGFSFDVFPFKTVNTVSDNGRQLYGRPDGLVGWQDTVHLAQLTKEDKEKEAVVVFQKEHGLRVTNFEADGPKGAEGSLDGKSQDGEERQD